MWYSHIMERKSYKMNEVDLPQHHEELLKYSIKWKKNVNDLIVYVLTLLCKENFNIKIGICIINVFTICIHTQVYTCTYYNIVCVCFAYSFAEISQNLVPFFFYLPWGGELGVEVFLSPL